MFSRMAPVVAVIALLLVAIPLAARGQRGGGGGGGENLTVFDTSLAITGDMSAAPLDEGSLNALFTAAFRKDVEEMLREKLGDDVEYPLTPESLRLTGLGGRDKSNQTFVAVLQVGYQDPPEELASQLAVEAPKVALELLRDRVHDFVETQHQLRESNLRQRRDLLIQQRDQLTERLVLRQHDLVARQAGAIESSDALREHYLQLKRRQRDDRLASVDAEARREAIVEQIARLRERASEEGPEQQSELLAAMKKAADERRERAESIKEEGQNARELAIAAKLIQNRKEALAQARHLYQQGEGSHREVSNLEAELRQAEHQRALAEMELKQQAEQAEAEAVQGRIAYLRQLEELQQAQFGSRLAKLNEMLTDVAVNSEEIAGRRQALEQEIAEIEAAIVERMKVDQNLERLERTVHQLDNQLRHVEQQLFEIEMQLDVPFKQEFAILPWGG